MALISCVIPAYNYGRYIARAVDSALAQDVAAEVEVIVVDDGSTDETASIVARYGARVRYVHKQNGGLNSAVDRGIAESRGDYIALLDADDTWPCDRLRVLLDVLERKPNAGLVYGEMAVVSDDGALVAPSYMQMQQMVPVQGRPLGSLMVRNVISGGASLVRASLKHAFHPIPAAAAYPDWWIAVNVARFADIEWIPHVVNEYRLHGSNMGLGAASDSMLATIRDHELKFRRWMLYAPHASELSTEGVLAVHRTFRSDLARISDHFAVDAAELVPVTSRDREQALAAKRQAAAALTRGDFAGAVAAYANASGHDPLDPIAFAWLRGAERAAVKDAQPGYTRAFITLASAFEVVTRPDMLAAYARAFRAHDDATLVLSAPSWSVHEASSRLAAAVSLARLDEEGAPDVLVETAEDAKQLTLADADALYTGLARRAMQLPAFDTSDLGSLRAAAEERWSLRAARAPVAA